MAAVVAIAVLLVLLNLRDLLGLLPHLWRGFTVARGNVSLEHNLPVARSRNATTAIYLLVLVLVGDRYFTPGSDAATGLSAADFLRTRVWIAAIAGWLLLRYLLFAFISRWRLHRFDSDSRLAVHRIFYNHLILLAIAVLATLPVLIAFRCPESGFRLAIQLEILMFWLLSLLREWQILRNYCGGFSTFLYLCGLEFIPAVLLAVVMTILQS